MSRAKENTGVAATIERLTGQKPCPEFLRTALRRYLRADDSIFRVEGKRKPTEIERLAAPGADTLVLNVLELDEAFRGETKIVTKIIGRKLNPRDLANSLEAAEAEIRRRFDIYEKWVRRFAHLKNLLMEQSIDLKKERLDERLRTKNRTAGSQHDAKPFGLRAIQELERIEERGLLGRLSAREYAEQADAYMSLGDFEEAGTRAAQAIKVDPHHARAWFIRVIAALRLRNASVAAMQHQNMIATEIAEPMSSQESNALQLAAEEACQAHRHRQSLEQMLPEALLNWPTINGRQFDHQEQWMIVRDLFIDQTLSRVVAAQSTRPGKARETDDGVEFELEFQQGGVPTIQSMIDAGSALNATEREVLTVLLAERDRNPWTFFDPRDPSYLVKDFKLLHLRWTLQLNGYEQHWNELRERFTEFPASEVERNILQSGSISKLWQLHLFLNGGIESVVDALDHWRRNFEAASASRMTSRLLEQYALLFHHEFASGRYTNCRDVTHLALGIANTQKDCAGRGSGVAIHPYQENVCMPVYSPIYWRYLEALATIKIAETMQIDECGISLLLAAELEARSFLKTQSCFWNVSIAYDEGGGEDYEEPPYGIDLRDTEPWISAINAVLASTPNASHSEALATLASSLAIAERPFAPGPFEFEVHSVLVHD